MRENEPEERFTSHVLKAEHLESGGQISVYPVFAQMLVMFNMILLYNVSNRRKTNEMKGLP